MPSEDYLRTYVYNQLNTSSFKSKDYQKYTCGNPKTFYYQYGDSSTWKQEETLICLFHTKNVNVSSTGKIANPSQAEVFIFNEKDKFVHAYSASSYTIDNTKILYSDNCERYTGSLTCKNLLLNTDFYQSRRDEELKTLIESQNGSYSVEPVNSDMTSTNNILYTIALILCVILSLSVIRRLFNRGVR